MKVNSDWSKKELFNPFFKKQRNPCLLATGKRSHLNQFWVFFYRFFFRRRLICPEIFLPKIFFISYVVVEILPKNRQT